MSREATNRGVNNQRRQTLGRLFRSLLAGGDLKKVAAGFYDSTTHAKKTSVIANQRALTSSDISVLRPVESWLAVAIS